MQTVYKPRGRAKEYSPLAREKRFWARINRSNCDGCWEWTGSSTGGKYRYGRVKQGGKLFLAHRCAWEFTNGIIPAGLFVCHHCDNPKCCNPAHLFLGTRADNAIDSVKKGRWGDNKGEKCGRAKLTEKDVREILLLYKRGEMQGAIAKRYGVSQPTIGFIVRGETWKCVARESI